eukprot:104517_1
MSSPITLNKLARSSLSDLLIRNKTFNRHNNDCNILHIVKIIGGIDKILSDYLSQTDPITSHLILNDNQISQIHTLLSLPHQRPLLPLTKISTSQTNISQSENKSAHIYYFDETDTFLGSLLSFHSEQRVLSILHNAILQVLLCVSIIAHVTLGMIMHKGEISLVYPIWTIGITGVLWLPYSILWMLSANRQGCTLIIHSFEFWFKLVYAIAYNVTLFWYDFGLHYNRWRHPEMKILASFCIAICNVLVIVCISMFDAFNINIKWKITLSTLLAVLYSLNATITQFVDIRMDDSLITISQYNTLSLRSLTVSACRILAIFLWKQAILTYARSRSNQCILIKHTPYIVWNKKETNVVDSVIVKSTSEIFDENDRKQKKCEEIEMKNVWYGEGKRHRNDSLSEDQLQSHDSTRL